jgi:hypothetical protein
MKGKFFCIWTHAKIGRILMKWGDKTHGDYKEFKKTISVRAGQSTVMKYVNWKPMQSRKLQ